MANKMLGTYTFRIIFFFYDFWNYDIEYSEEKKMKSRHLSIWIKANQQMNKTKQIANATHIRIIIKLKPQQQYKANSEIFLRWFNALKRLYKKFSLYSLRCLSINVFFSSFFYRQWASEKTEREQNKKNNCSEHDEQTSRELIESGPWREQINNRQDITYTYICCFCCYFFSRKKKFCFEYVKIVFVYYISRE